MTYRCVSIKSRLRQSQLVLQSYACSVWAKPQ